MTTKEIWIVEGTVTNPDCYPDGEVQLGDTEWQFSDGPPGERGSSNDFLSLEEGLRHYGRDVIYHFDPMPDPESHTFTVIFTVPHQELVDHWAVYNQVLSPTDTIVEILQHDLYDEAGMSGEFTVFSATKTYKSEAAA